MIYGGLIVVADVTWVEARLEKNKQNTIAQIINQIPGLFLHVGGSM
jgi:hypothetical protein